MEQDYSKDLTFILTGSGDVKMPLLSQALEQHVFGTLEDREVRVIVPLDHVVTKGQETFFVWAKAIGVDLTIVKFANFKHPILDFAKSVIDVSTMPEMMEKTFAELAQAELMNDNQTTFISIYNHNSADLAWVEEAKNYDWLTTLNLVEGLIDHFDGYESAEDRAARKVAEEKAAELEQQDKEELKAAKKTAAKKATTPRKRAASKPKVEEPTEPVIEPEKPVQSLELEGTIVVPASTLPVALEPAKISRQNGDTWEETKDGYVYGFQMINGEIQSTGSMGLASELTHVPQDLKPSADVWKDVAQNVPAKTQITVSSEDMVKLGDAMQKMASGFADAIDVYKKMVGGE